MLDAGSLILEWCAGLRVACAPASRANAIQHFSGAQRAVGQRCAPGDLLADAWLLGRLGSGTPPSPSSFPPFSWVQSWGGALGQS